MEKDKRFYFSMNETGSPVLADFREKARVCYKQNPLSGKIGYRETERMFLTYSGIHATTLKTSNFN